MSYSPHRQSLFPTNLPHQSLVLSLKPNRTNHVLISSSLWDLHDNVVLPQHNTVGLVTVLQRIFPRFFICPNASPFSLEVISILVSLFKIWSLQMNHLAWSVFNSAKIIHFIWPGDHFSLKCSGYFVICHMIVIWLSTPLRFSLPSFLLPRLVLSFWAFINFKPSDFGGRNNS